MAMWYRFSTGRIRHVSRSSSEGLSDAAGVSFDRGDAALPQDGAIAHGRVPLQSIFITPAPVVYFTRRRKPHCDAFDSIMAE